MLKSVAIERFPWSAAALACLVWLMSLAYGFQYFVMDDRAAHLAYFRLATVPFVLLVIALTFLALSPARFSLDPDRWPAWLGPLMMSVSWVLSVYFHSSFIAPLPWVLVALLPPCVAAVSHRFWGDRGSLYVFLLAALALFLVLIANIPHDGRGDMLEIIGFAATDLLRGETPFRPYLTVSGKEVPFGYWPLIWLPYVPLVAMGLDLRVLNVLGFLLIALFFLRAAGGGQGGARILGVTLFPFMLSPPIVQMVSSGHLWLYWLLVCLMLWLLVRGRYLAAAVALGLCLASRPTVLFLAAPVLGYVWSRAGWRVALTGGGLALGVFALLNLPFYLIYGEDFIRNSFGALVGFGQVLTHFSITGILQGAGFPAGGRLGQVLVALLALAVVVRTASLSPGQFVVLVGLTYVWEVLFASYATRYLYFPGFFLIALGVTIAARAGVTKS